MTTSITSTITEGQERQYRRVVEDAARSGIDLALQQLPLDKDAFQWGVLHGSELSQRIARTVVDTTRTLLVNHRMEDLERQVGNLRYYFERNCYGLKRNDLLWNKEWIADLVDAPLPPGMQWFAIPRWERIAETYEDAVKAIWGVIGERWHERCNYIDGADVDVTANRNSGHPRQTDLSIEAWKQLHREQGGDILVVPARLEWGLQPDGIASPLQNKIVFRRKFGLGAFAVGCMLLTFHPKKFPRGAIFGECIGDVFPSGSIPDLWFFGERTYNLAYGGCRFTPHSDHNLAWGYLWKLRKK